MTDQPFLTDVKTLRERARRHMERGAVTEGYGADIGQVIHILNEALATEIVCTLRYKRHHFMASGLNSQAAAAEFLEHANEEQQHADQIAARIVQLGGAPNFSVLKRARTSSRSRLLSLASSDTSKRPARGSLLLFL